MRPKSTYQIYEEAKRLEFHDTSCWRLLLQYAYEGNALISDTKWRIYENDFAYIYKCCRKDDRSEVEFEIAKELLSSAMLDIPRFLN